MNQRDDIPSGLYRLFIKQSVFICLSSFLFLIPISVNGYELYVGTEKTGTFSHFSGRMLCRSINSQQSDIKCSVRPADDQIDILTNLVSGSFDLALTDSQTLHAVTSRMGVFQYLDIDYRNMAVLLPFYDKPFTFVYRGDGSVSNLDGIKGKKINVGSPGSMAYGIMGLLMKQKGWTPKDFELFEKLSSSQSQDSLAFCHGSVEVMAHVGVHPSLPVQRLLKQCKGQLLSLNEEEIETISKDYPFLKSMEISAPSYPSHSAKVKTIGSRVFLLGSTGLDEETAFTIAKILQQSRKRLSTSHPALGLVVSNDFEKNIGKLKLHPGSKKLFNQ